MDTRPSLPLTRLVRSLPAGPPPVHAFSSGARTCDPEGDDLLTWLLPQAPDEAHGLRLRVRSGGLPSPTLAPARPDLALWELPEPGWTRGRGSATRTLLSLAAAVPLALAPAVAQAGDEVEEEPTEEAAEVEAAPAGSLVDLLGQGQEIDDLSTTGQRLWWSLADARVELTLNDGAKLFGRVLTHVPDEIALILDQDGFVMRVPKDSILRVRVLELPGASVASSTVRPEVEEAVRTPPTGKAPTVAGAIITAAGGGLLTVYAVGAAIDSSFGYYMAPMAIVGGLTLGGGIPILIAGLAQQEQYGKWSKEHGPVQPELEVGMAPTVGGWSGALTLRW